MRFLFASARGRTEIVLTAALSLGVLLVAACSVQAASPAPANVARPGTGVLETAAGRYAFTPSTCAVHKEDGVDDIEIAGPGMAPDGEKFYFELSSTGNAMTLKLGVDKRFASADRKIQAGRYVSKPFMVDVSGRTISISGLALVNENGQPVDAGASLRIDCG